LALGATVQQLNVSNTAELESTISSYIAQGFVVSNRTVDAVTLFKKKEFNIIWAIIGFFACVIPLIIYTIIYSTQSDQMVVIRVGGILKWSEDHKWWWDGAKWKLAAEEMPPGVQVSDDRRMWWDGTTWQPMPTGAPSALAAPSPLPMADAPLETEDKEL
jgi:hypothetical protein